MVFLDHLIKHEHNANKMREESLMCNPELVELAVVTPATINRIERDEDYRMETKRKVILALEFLPYRERFLN